MIFLGLEVNSLLLTLRIPEEKMEEIRQELRRWKLGMDYSLKEMQRLVGLLNFAASCIRPGRIYFSRLLNLLRLMLVEKMHLIVMQIEAMMVAMGVFLLYLTRV